MRITRNEATDVTYAYTLDEVEHGILTGIIARFLFEPEAVDELQWNGARVRDVCGQILGYEPALAASP